MLTKTSQKNSRWSEEDNAWAIKQHDLRRTNYYIARKLGRTEVAVQVHLSKMRMNVKAFTLGAAMDDFVVIPTGDTPYMKVLKKRSKLKASKPKAEPAQSEWITLFTGLAGGVFGATLMHFIL